MNRRFWGAIAALFALVLGGIVYDLIWENNIYGWAQNLDLLQRCGAITGLGCPLPLFLDKSTCVTYSSYVPSSHTNILHLTVNTMR
jgi:hypothetical protein